MAGHLNAAAIVLHRAFSEAGINYGFFGGYAVLRLGGSRVSENIDCVVSADQDQVANTLTEKLGFEKIPSSRRDLVKFTWTSPDDSSIDIKTKIKIKIKIDIYNDSFTGQLCQLLVMLPRGRC